MLPKTHSANKIAHQLQTGTLIKHYQNTTPSTTIVHNIQLLTKATHDSKFSQGWDNPTVYGQCIGGLKGLPSAPEIAALLQAIVVKLSQFNRYLSNHPIASETSILHLIKQALTGIQAMSKDCSEVEQLIRKLSETLSFYKGDVADEDISDMLYKLRLMGHSSQPIYDFLGIIATAINNSDLHFDNNHIIRALSNLRLWDYQHQSVQQILTALAEKIHHNKKVFNGQALTQVFFSLQHMGDSPAVEKILLALIAKVELCSKNLTLEELGQILSYTHNMTTKSHAVVQLLSLLGNMISIKTEAIKATTLGYALRGLYGKSSTFPSIQLIMRSLAETITSNATYFEPSCFITGLYGLQQMEDNSPYALQLLTAINSRIIRSSTLLTPIQIANALAGLQNMSADNECVSEMLEYLFSHCPFIEFKKDSSTWCQIVGSVLKIAMKSATSVLTIERMEHFFPTALLKQEVSSLTNVCSIDFVKTAFVHYIAAQHLQNNELDLHQLDHLSALFLLKYACEEKWLINRIIFGRSSHSKAASIGKMEQIVRLLVNQRLQQPVWSDGSVELNGVMTVGSNLHISDLLPNPLNPSMPLTQTVKDMIHFYITAEERHLEPTLIEFTIAQSPEQSKIIQDFILNAGAMTSTEIEVALVINALNDQGILLTSLAERYVKQWVTKDQLRLSDLLPAQPLLQPLASLLALNLPASLLDTLEWQDFKPLITGLTQEAIVQLSSKQTIINHLNLDIWHLLSLEPLIKASLTSPIFYLKSLSKQAYDYIFTHNLDILNLSTYQLDSLNSSEIAEIIHLSGEKSGYAILWNNPFDSLENLIKKFTILKSLGDNPFASISLEDLCTYSLDHSLFNRRLELSSLPQNTPTIQSNRSNRADECPQTLEPSSSDELPQFQDVLLSTLQSKVYKHLHATLPTSLMWTKNWEGHREYINNIDKSKVPNIVRKCEQLAKLPPKIYRLFSLSELACATPDKPIFNFNCEVKSIYAYEYLLKQHINILQLNSTQLKLITSANLHAIINLSGDQDGYSLLLKCSDLNLDLLQKKYNILESLGLNNFALFTLNDLIDSSIKNPIYKLKREQIVSPSKLIKRGINIFANYKILIEQDGLETPNNRVPLKHQQSMLELNPVFNKLSQTIDWESHKNVLSKLSPKQITSLKSKCIILETMNPDTYQLFTLPQLISSPLSNSFFNDKPKTIYAKEYLLRHGINVLQLKKHNIILISSAKIANIIKLSGGIEGYALLWNVSEDRQNGLIDKFEKLNANGLGNFRLFTLNNLLVVNFNNPLLQMASPETHNKLELCLPLLINRKLSLLGSYQNVELLSYTRQNIERAKSNLPKLAVGSSDMSLSEIEKNFLLSFLSRERFDIVQKGFQYSTSLKLGNLEIAEPNVYEQIVTHLCLTNDTYKFNLIQDLNVNYFKKLPFLDQLMFGLAFAFLFKNNEILIEIRGTNKVNINKRDLFSEIHPSLFKTKLFHQPHNRLSNFINCIYLFTAPVQIRVIIDQYLSIEDMTPEEKFRSLMIVFNSSRIDLKQTLYSLFISNIRYYERYFLYRTSLIFDFMKQTILSINKKLAPPMQWLLILLSSPDFDAKQFQEIDASYIKHLISLDIIKISITTIAELKQFLIFSPIELHNSILNIPSIKALITSINDLIYLLEDQELYVLKAICETLRVNAVLEEPHFETEKAQLLLKQELPNLFQALPGSIYPSIIKIKGIYQLIDTPEYFASLYNSLYSYQHEWLTKCIKNTLINHVVSSRDSIARILANLSSNAFTSLFEQITNNDVLQLLNDIDKMYDLISNPLFSPTQQEQLFKLVPASLNKKELSIKLQSSIKNIALIHPDEVSLIVNVNTVVQPEVTINLDNLECLDKEELKNELVKIIESNIHQSLVVTGAELKNLIELMPSDMLEVIARQAQTNSLSLLSPSKKAYLSSYAIILYWLYESNYLADSKDRETFFTKYLIYVPLLDIIQFALTASYFYKDDFIINSHLLSKGMRNKYREVNNRLRQTVFITSEYCYSNKYYMLKLVKGGARPFSSIPDKMWPGKNITQPNRVVILKIFNQLSLKKKKILFKILIKISKPLFDNLFIRKYMADIIEALEDKNLRLPAFSELSLELCKPEFSPDKLASIRLSSLENESVTTESIVSTVSSLPILKQFLEYIPIELYHEVFKLKALVQLITSLDDLQYLLSDMLAQQSIALCSALQQSTLFQEGNLSSCTEELGAQTFIRFLENIAPELYSHLFNINPIARLIENAQVLGQLVGFLSRYQSLRLIQSAVATHPDLITSIGLLGQVLCFCEGEKLVELFDALVPLYPQLFSNKASLPKLITEAGLSLIQLRALQDKCSLFAENQQDASECRRVLNKSEKQVKTKDALPKLSIFSNSPQILESEPKAISIVSKRPVSRG